LPVIGAGLAYYFSSIQEPSYEAKATLLVQQRSGNLSLGNIDFGQNSQIAATYQRLATARPFFDYVAQNGEIPISASDLSDVLSATIGDSPPWVDLRVEHSNPVVAAEVAQVAADQFIQYVIEQRLSEIAQLQVTAAAQGILDIADLTAAQFAAIDSLTLLEPAEIPEFPVFPRTRLNVIIGFAVGLVIAAGSVLLIETVRDTVRIPEQVRSRFGLNLLGTIHRFPVDDDQDRIPIFQKYPNSVHSEMFRQLRANFDFAAAPGGGNVFMVTSPGAEEGKSTIISNLAVAIGQSGKRVVIVEGDLRRPSLSRTFGFASGGSGLVNLLVDPSVEISDVTNRTDAQNVDIILVGLTPPNPTELLGSRRMAELVETLKNEYAIVLIDTPPSLLLSDGITIAPLTDGIVIVARSNRTRSSSLLSVVNNMKQTNVRIIGVVINDHQRSRFSSGYYYDKAYYYSPDDQPSGNGASPGGVIPRIKRGWSKVIRR